MLEPVCQECFLRAGDLPQVRDCRLSPMDESVFLRAGDLPQVRDCRLSAFLVAVQCEKTAKLKDECG